MKPIVVLLLAVAAAGAEDAPTALDVAGSIFHSCVRFGSFACVRPMVAKFLSGSLKTDAILLSRDLSVVASDRKEVDPRDLPRDGRSKTERIRLPALEKIDDFLDSHELRVKLPKEIVRLVPDGLLESVPRELRVPLSETEDVARGRGFVKKVMIPFLLGLKVKATTFIPIAVALIALKTWKALTLGLLSLVLSAAMVIFKFAKPKVVNYEVYHYPSHHPPAPPMIDHPYVDHHHGYGRSDGQSLAYAGQRK